jgi:hypothetical protein
VEAVVTDLPDLVAWLRACLDEDELAWQMVAARDVVQMLHGRPLAPHMLAEVAAKRAILDLHESWPVLVETQPEFTTTADDSGSMAIRMSKRVAWLTEQEYRARFGDEPPTSPIVLALAQPYAGREGWREEWAT